MPINPEWTPEEIAGVEFCEGINENLKSVAAPYSKLLSYGLARASGLYKETHQFSFGVNAKQPCGHRASIGICYEPWTRELGYRANSITGEFTRIVTPEEFFEEAEEWIGGVPERRMNFIRQIHPAILEAMVRGKKVIPRRQTRPNEWFKYDVVWKGAAELWTPDETALAADIIKGKVAGIQPYFTKQQNEFDDLEGDITDCLCATSGRNRSEAQSWLKKQQRADTSTPDNYLKYLQAQREFS